MEDMTERRTPLLEKVYFEGCPGCKQDRKKAASSGIPYTEFFYVWIVTLCTGCPFMHEMSFADIIIVSIYILHDKGLACCPKRRRYWILCRFCWIVFNTLFGLSTTYWMAITTRFLLGSLNGLLGPIKAYSIEVCREEHQALGLSLVTTAWGIGLIIGPAIGGFFAQPAEKYPEIFSQDSLFGRFPYFLPCLCISVFAAAVFIASLWLPETVHKHDSYKFGDATIEHMESSPSSSDVKGYVDECEKQDSHPKKSLFKNWPLMSSVIVYCIFSLHDMAYTEIFSLWAVSDKSYGGLSFSSQDVGEVLAISGLGLLVYQLLVYPSAEKLLGPIKLMRAAAALSIPLLAAYPFMTKLSGLLLTLIVNCASLMKNVLSVSIIIGLFILQNNAVSQEQRGAANGIAMTAMSLFKAIAPAVGGAIFSWAQKRQQAFFFPGDQMVFFLLLIIELIGFIFCFKPFLAQPRK